LREVAMRGHAGLLLGTLFLATSAHPIRAQPGDGQVVKTPTEVQFKAPLAGGVQAAVLYGDPSKPGVYVVRIKVPPGYKSSPHFHTDEYRGVVVISGTLYFAISDVRDDSKLRAYPAGTFFTEPPKMAHYAEAKDTEVVFDVTGIGPTSTVPVPVKQ
jgi:quercetin dioxygenase-like cupin family protein